MHVLLTKYGEIPQQWNNKKYYITHEEAINYIVYRSHLLLFLFASPEPTGAFTALLNASLVSLPGDALWRTGLSLAGRIIPWLNSRISTERTKNLVLNIAKKSDYNTGLYHRVMQLGLKIIQVE